MRPKRETTTGPHRVHLRWSDLPREVVMAAVELARNGDASADDLVANGVPGSLARSLADPETGMVDAGALVASVATDLGLRVAQVPTPAATVRTARAIRAHFARQSMRDCIEGDVASKRAAKGGA